MEFEIEIIRKNIKNLHLYVLPPNGKIRVTAPPFITQGQIEAFVERNTPWIIKKQAEIKERSERAELKNGGHLMLWGNEYTLRIIPSSKSKVERVQNEIILYLKEGAQKEKLIKEFYRNELKQKAAEKIEQWENTTGFKCSSWQTKDMKTRWGSCNTKTKKIWLSLRLAELNEECLDYVILHELTHTVIPNHQFEFKQTLSKYMKNWKIIQASMH